MYQTADSLNRLATIASVAVISLPFNLNELVGNAGIITDDYEWPFYYQFFTADATWI
jgi:hypothetical protein